MASEIQDLPKWVGRYARNRTLPMLLVLGVAAALWIVVIGLTFLGSKAHQAGQSWAVVVCAVLIIAAVIANTWISVPQWGGRRLLGLAARFYAREGEVEIGSPGCGKKMNWVGFVFMILITATVAATFLGILNLRNLLPVTATYTVPFLTLVLLSQRQRVGHLMLLWPALFLVHAVLIVAGAPILFEGRLDVLNILIPATGYGVLAALVSHLYSRYALRKVRRLARVEGDDHA